MLLRCVVALWMSLCLLVPSVARAEGIDRKTPRAAMITFLELCRAGDFTKAAQGLDTLKPSPSSKKYKPAELAQQLYVVLERASFSISELSDNEKGNPDDGVSDVVATLPLERVQVQILLAPVAGRGWLFSAITVAELPALYDRYGPTLLEERLPASITEPRLGAMALWKWVGLAVALLIALGVGNVVNWMFVFVARRFTAHNRVAWDDALIRRLRRPSLAFAVMVVFRVLLELLGLPNAKMEAIGTVLKIGFIGVAAWAVHAAGGLFADVLEQRAISAATTQKHELRARGVRTQVQVLRRVFSIAIGVVTAALMLMQFQLVRNVGMSLLASAGVAGVVLGLAAQRTIGSLIAGIQLSITQPVRIGDEVVIEKEFGMLEEITLTYVVVKLWDERRLLVPMSRLLEQPFENWTRASTALKGTVMLNAHPALPIAALRAELARLLEDNPLWDKDTQKVQVADVNDRGMQLRVVLSAADATKLAQLRYELREKLITWLAAYEGGRYLLSIDTTRLAAPAS